MLDRFVALTRSDIPLPSPFELNPATIALLAGFLLFQFDRRNYHLIDVKWGPAMFNETEWDDNVHAFRKVDRRDLNADNAEKLPLRHSAGIILSTCVALWALIILAVVSYF